MQFVGSGDVSVRPASYHVALLQNSHVQKRNLSQFLQPLTFVVALLRSEQYAVCLGGSIGMHVSRG